MNRNNNQSITVFTRVVYLSLCYPNRHQNRTWKYRFLIKNSARGYTTRMKQGGYRTRRNTVCCCLWYALFSLCRSWLIYLIIFRFTISVRFIVVMCLTFVEIDSLGFLYWLISIKSWQCQNDIWRRYVLKARGNI